ncbi:MAG: response regulator transcription factor [Chloroflexota bacterium]|nr:response regulator transcription factor [Chloroflexota bacterium]MDE3192285.1 response regulator transcription factor [Chloroflexota bacterium]
MSALRILAIEDDPDLSYLYQSFLAAEGYEVLLARDAHEAVDMLRREPDVVLLDLMLPDVDGYTLLRHMRANAATRSIPVIVVSAAIPPGRHHIRGADAVVHKPFEFDGLLRTIEGVSHQAHVQ